MSKASLFSKLASGNGNLIPDSDEHRDLGSASNKWKDLYLSGSTLILGNVTLKDSGGIPSFENLGGAKVKLDMSAMTTADLAEHNTARYFTETRTRSSISFSTGSADYDSATGGFTIPATTDHVSEGTNLYYTDSRADARAQLKIDDLVDAAPGTLDTLNELAAALGDDANFSTTVTNSIATKLPLAGGTMTGDIDMDNNTISNIDRLTFNDPGPNEGLSWTGGSLWKIYESPDNLTTNSAGNLQFVSGTSDRRMTLSTAGMLELPSTTGGITIAANARITAGSGNKIDFNNSSLNNVNKIFINDPGPDEGIEWLGGNAWSIYESPNDLTTNSGGNLQFVTGSPTSGISVTRRMTLDTSGDLSLLSGNFIGNVEGDLITDVTVTVASGTNQYGTGNKYFFDGAVSPVLHLQPGRTYKFDQSDSSNSGHPLRFSTNANNSPSGTYSTGVTVNGTPGSSGAYTQIVVSFATPRLHYYCTNHSGMGGSGPDNTANFDGAFSSLTGTPTTIAGYGITDAFDGAYGSLTGVPSTFTPAAHNQAWSTITSTPTTISGYGITDAQATLVSGTNIKTVNGTSLLGSGNITISGGGGGSGTVDSAQTISLARESISVTTGSASGGGALSYNNSTGVLTFQPSTNSGGGGSGTVDSADIISIVDSAYVQARQVGIATNIIVDGGVDTFKFTSDSGQSVFTGADSAGNTLAFDPINVNVYLNGIFLQKGADYTTTGNHTLTLSPALEIDQDVIIQNIDVKTSSALVSGGVNTYVYTADSGQTVFSGSDDNSNSLQFTGDNLAAYLNGVLLLKTDDYNLSNENTLTLTFAAATSDEISIVSFDPTSTDNLATYFDSDYITNRVSVSYPARGSVSNYFYTADSGQTAFTGADDNGSSLIIDQDNSNVMVSVNGVLIINGTDYTTTASSNTLTLVDSASAGDQIAINTFSNLYRSPGIDSQDMLNIVDSAYITGRISEIYVSTDIVDSAYITGRISEIYAGNRSIDTFRYVSTEGQTTYTGNDANGNTLAFSDGAVQVHLNGILLTKSQDYTTSSGNSVTLLDSINSGNEVLIENFSSKFILDLDGIVDSAYVAARIPNHSATTNINKFKFTTTAPQTVFTGNDDAGNSLAFDSNNIVVFMNGVNLYQGEDFTTSGGNTITLTEATDSDFELVVNNFDKYFTTQLSSIDSAYVTARIPQYGATATVDKYRFVATSNQTTFSGADADGTTLSYTAGTVQVFLNGILLTPTIDYTATNGTSITLVDPANAGFELLIYDYTKQFNINVIDISFVDSAYVQARQATADLSTIDSAYVQARQTTTDLSSYSTTSAIESRIAAFNILFGG